MTPPLAIALTIFATILGGIAAVCLKIGATKTFPHHFLNRYSAIGFSLYGVSTIITVIALKWGELKVIYSLSSVTYIWIGLLSYAVLGEKLPAKRIIGIGCIIVGILLITAF